MMKKGNGNERLPAANERWQESEPLGLGQFGISKRWLWLTAFAESVREEREPISLDRDFSPVIANRN
jgi:hypothetical protein